jgi:hypothetical protein
MKNKFSFEQKVTLRTMIVMINLIIWSPIVFAQSPAQSFYQNFLSTFRPDSIEYKNHMKEIYRNYLITAPRLSPNGDFAIANQAIMDYVSNFSSASLNGLNSNCPNSLSTATWTEKGPFSPIPFYIHSPNPGAGQVHRITFDPNYDGVNNRIIYASSSFGGLWKTEDRGEHWSNVNTDVSLPFTYTADLAIDPNNSSNLFLATGYADGEKIQTPITGSNSVINPIFSFGVYRSLDAGQTWISITSGQLLAAIQLNNPNGGITIRQLKAVRYPHPTTQGQSILSLYALTSDGLYVCNDPFSSAIWTRIPFFNLPGIDEDFRGLEFMPGNPDVIYLSGRDILKSIDRGATWSKITGAGTGLDWSQLAADGFFPDIINLAVTPADPGRIFSYVVGHKTFPNPNNPNEIWNQPAAKVFVRKAQLWEQLFDGLTPYVPNSDGDFDPYEFYSPFYSAIACNPIIADELYFGNVRIHKISNFDSGTPVVFSFGYWGSGHPDIQELVFEPSTTPSLFIGNHGGVFVLEPNIGIVHRSEGLNISTIWAGDISQMTKDIFAVGLQDQGGQVFKTTTNEIVSTQGGDGYSCNILEKSFDESIWLGNGVAPLRYKIQHQPLTRQGALGFTMPTPNEFNFDGTINPSPDDCKTFQARKHPKTGNYWFGFCELQEYQGFNCQGATDCWDQQSDLSITEHEAWKRQIADFQIAPTNPDVIYLVTQGVAAIPSGNSWSLESKIYKSNTGGINGIFNPNQAKFNVISNNLPQCSYCGPGENAVATGIAVSDVNENHLWVSFSGYDGNYKVFKTIDGGLNWENADPDQTLSNLPVNDILFQPGSNNRVIIATDAGVYFTENNDNCWRKLGQNLPNCRVVELKMNFCSNSLIAFTFGRGAWEVDLPVSLLPENYLEITQSQTWSTSKTFDGNIKIKTGTTLTLQNAGLNMAANAKIVIEPGAEFIIDGGIVTNNCGKMWHGIEIWGNSNQPQVSSIQGTLRVINGGTISFAHEAVSVFNSSASGQTGGIIICENANFINNRRSVSFHSYLPQNKSHFYNSIFEINDNYLQEDPFFAHVTMWDVKGVRFLGCEFYNNSTAPVMGNNLSRGSGVISYDANFTIDQFCLIPSTQLGGTCLSVNPSKFSGFYTCVDALKILDSKNYIIDQSIFSNFVYGIHSAAFDQAIITRNSFAVGADFFDTNIETCAGIVVETGTGYQIQENSFSKYPRMVEQRTVGIGLTNTIIADENNTVYKNNFEDLYVANLSNGKNQGIPGAEEKGVKYECNSNNNRESLGSWDFDVEPDWYNQSGTPPPGTGVATKQGSSGMAAGNTFTHHPINGQTNYETDFKVYLPGISQTYEYYYWNILPETPLFISSNVLDITSPIIFQNTCDSRIRENNGEERSLGSLSEEERIENETSFFNAYQSKEQSELLLAQLTDGGNTPALKEEVETANSNQTWLLRQELLGNAPHLSKAVLTEAAENTVALPEAVLVEILEANPDVLKDQEFLDFLAQKNQPLPSYIIDSLRARSTLITARTLLNESIQLEQQRMHNIANEMLVHYLNDTLDTGAVKLIEWMANKNTFEADLAIAGLWFKQGRTQDALNLLYSLPSNRNLNPATEALLNRTLNSLQVAQNYQINHALSASEVEQLNTIAQGKGDYPATLAKNILSLHQQQPYPTHLVLPQQQANARKAKVNNYKATSVLSALQVQPNPADQWLAFTVGELKGLNAQSLIQISNAQGQVMSEINLDKGKGQYLLDTRSMINGIYFYKVIGVNEGISGKFVVQHE